MLDASDFKNVASNGFGDRHNSYAWSMEWFKGRLYVGTLRDILWFFAKTGGHTYFETYPVPLPPLAEMDLRARIWRYTPEPGTWEQVYTSPVVSLRDAVRARRANHRLPSRGRRRWRVLSGLVTREKGRVVIRELLRLSLEWARAGFTLELGRDLGYRNMVVHTDRHGTEALYAASTGAASQLLRLTDTGFEASPVFNSRAVASFRGRLYACPVGGFSPTPAVAETDDPTLGATVAGAWRPASEPGFGNPDNFSTFEMVVFNDHLYVGTVNEKGFEVWKTDARGSAPYRWRKVVTGGGHKAPGGPVGTISMYPFGEWLYVGGGRPLSHAGMFDPIPGELIRIAPDDTWEVVVGNARETHQGFKPPISGMPAGFGNQLAMYVWRMEAHDGWLYAGTNDATTFLRYTPRHRIGPRAQRWIEQHGGVEKTLEAEAGFDLWRTRDGVHWTCVTHTGLGSPLQHGLRTLKSTPVGLFAGTASNFFSETRDPKTGEPGGGLEIWLGSR